MTQDPTTYKEQHEAFVSNLQGSSVFEVLACVSQVPAFIMLLKLVQRNSKPSIIRDFLLFTLPTLLSITIFADLNYWSLLVLVVGLGYYHSIDRNRVIQPSPSPTTPPNPSNVGETDDTTYLTLFKGANVALTCLAILAIDFRVFPRRFGKTETFGVSLMDVGVGAFIFSSAVTSKHARGLPPTTPPTPPTPPPIHSTPLNSRQTSPHSPQSQLTQSLSMSRILTACSDVMPMRRFLVLGLGFGRLVILKAINYQEHVSEYGVHWNFFMTLFSVWVVADVIHALVPRRSIVWIALVWLSLYQTALCFTSLTSFMFSAERGGDILSANKEGVISLNGYIPLYLLSETAAHEFFHSHVTPPPLPPPLNNTDSHTTSDRILPIPTSSPTTSLNLRKPQQHPLVDAEEPVTSFPLSLSKESEHSGEIAPPCPALPQHLSNSLNYALLRQLSLSTSLLWLFWLWLATTMQPTSRRLCNASYVILVLAMCLTMVSICHIADVFGGRNVPILTLQYMNHHSVIVFLAANLLTGLVNNVMRTIYASDWLALLVLAVYGLLVTTSAWLAEYFLHHHRVR